MYYCTLLMKLVRPVSENKLGHGNFLGKGVLSFVVQPDPRARP